MALLAICFACSIFMFSVLLFRGLTCPLHRASRGGAAIETEDGSGEIGAFRSGAGGTVECHRNCVARVVLAETGDA